MWWLDRAVKAEIKLWKLLLQHGGTVTLTTLSHSSKCGYCDGWTVLYKQKWKWHCDMPVFKLLLQHGGTLTSTDVYQHWQSVADVTVPPCCKNRNKSARYSVYLSRVYTGSDYCIHSTVYSTTAQHCWRENKLYYLIHLSTRSWRVNIWSTFIVSKFDLIWIQ